MARTSFCKKCGKEVEPGEICPLCGAKLGRNAAHVVWCRERRPIQDWMCWNSLMRLILPAFFLVVLLVVLSEGLSGGFSSVQKLLQGSFLWILFGSLAGVILLTGLILLLRGKELLDYEISGKGVHVTCYIPNPTVVNLLMHFQSPGLLKQADQPELTVIRCNEADLPWSSVSRVQFWAEKCMILFYSPHWWMRISVTCLPATWMDSVSFIQEKLGKKKKVILPYGLRQMPVSSGKKTQT